MNHLVIAILSLATLALPAQAAELPDIPAKASAVTDKPFIAAMAIEAGAITSDMTTTAIVNGRRQGCFTFEGGQRFGQTVCSSSIVERDPWFGAHPSNARLVFENAGIFAGEAALAYEFKKPHSWLPRPVEQVARRLWWVPLAYQSQMHIRLAIHNGRLR
jgi:hypothetical protein